MKKHTTLTILILTVLALSACAKTYPGTQEVYEAYEVAMANSDLEAALSYIDNDAVFDVPVGTLEGKDAIEGFLQESIDGGGEAALSENCVVDGTLLNCDFSISFGPMTVEGKVEVTVEKGLITTYSFLVGG